MTERRRLSLFFRQYTDRRRANFSSPFSYASSNTSSSALFFSCVPSASSSEMTEKSLSTPATKKCERMSLEQKECMVEISAPGTSASCFLSFSRCFASVSGALIALINSFLSFSFICAAAFFVKVTASISLTSAPAVIRRTIFSIMTVVLPLPADAETMVFPSAFIASSCSVVKLLICVLPAFFSFPMPARDLRDRFWSDAVLDPFGR